MNLGHKIYIIIQFKPVISCIKGTKGENYLTFNIVF